MEKAKADEEASGGTQKTKTFKTKSFPSFWEQLKASIRRIQLKKRRRRWITVSEIIVPLLPLTVLMVIRYGWKDLSYEESYEELQSFDVWSSAVLRERIRYNFTTRMHELVVLYPERGIADLYPQVVELGKEVKINARTYFHPALDVKVEVRRSAVDFPNRNYFAVVRIHSIGSGDALNYTVSQRSSATSYSIPVITRRNESVTLDQCREFGKDRLPSSRNCDALRYYRSGYVSLVALIDFSWMSVSKSVWQYIHIVEKNGHYYTCKVLFQLQLQLQENMTRDAAPAFSPPHLQVALVPKEAFRRGNTETVAGMIPYFVVISLTLYIPYITANVVEEKERKVRQLLRISGLRDSAYWYDALSCLLHWLVFNFFGVGVGVSRGHRFSWAFSNALMVFAISLGGSLIVHFIPPESEVIRLIYKFFFFIEYEFSLVMFGLMLASFFKNSRVRFTLKPSPSDISKQMLVHLLF